MEQDSNPFWEHPMVPGSRDSLPEEGPVPGDGREADEPTNDFGVAVSIPKSPKSRAVRREPVRQEQEPAQALEPWQQQEAWSGGWQDFLENEQPEAEPYRDEFDEMLASEERERPSLRLPGMPQRAVAIAACAALVCLLGGFVYLAVDFAYPTPKSHSTRRAASAAQTSSKPIASSAALPPTSTSTSTTDDTLLPGAHATPGCVDTKSGDGGTVAGTASGGTDSGPDAILWFEHSYYVERSAARAWQVVAPGSDVHPVDRIQHGIDTVPLGTLYCVHVTPLAATTDLPVGTSRWHVELAERRPGQDNYVIDQIVSTVQSVMGTTLISDIAPVG